MTLQRTYKKYTYHDKHHKGNVKSDIPLKKQYGQHFLRDPRIVDTIIHSVMIDAKTNVFEIGCGDGFLTRAILGSPLARLWIFEIDPAWAQYVVEHFPDDRLRMMICNILEADLGILEPHAPWMLLANLPYQITFPILYKLKQYRHLISEGVIMVQEEVAQKLVANHGRGYGLPSLFFQNYFDWKVLDKIPPGAFFPPPKVFSRLLHFKVKENPTIISHEEEFWKFIKICFKQPRRTLKNNLAQTSYPFNLFGDEILALRAQQLDFQKFLEFWALIGENFSNR